MKALKILVKGKVQGVFYRASAAKMAEQYRIFGHAKNLKNGDVEIVAQGEPGSLQLFVDWCWHGPSDADVRDVVVQEIPLSSVNDFKTF